MKRPEDVIKSMAYIEPHTFESEREATIFYSYLEQIAYIEYLEDKLGKMIENSNSSTSKYVISYDPASEGGGSSLSGAKIKKR